MGAEQEGAAPDAPADASTDDIVSDILGSGKQPANEAPPEEVQEEEEPEAETPPDDEEDEDELPPAAEDEDEEGEPAEGDLVAARAALKAGDPEKAFLLAFGKKPEEVHPTPHVWTAFRKANEREAAKRQAERQAFEGEVAEARQHFHGERVKIQNTIEALRPYEKFYLAEQSFEKDGDPQRLVEIIEGITKRKYDDAQKLILTKTRISPSERAMRDRLAQLEAKLTEKDQAREQQQEQQSKEQLYQADLQYIRGRLTGKITEVPRFAERIYRIIERTRNAVGNTKTVEQAAAIVLRKEKERISKHPFVKKPGKPGVPPQVSTAARTLAQRSGKGGAPLRRNSQNNGASSHKEESTDDIVSDILKGRPTARRSA